MAAGDGDEGEGGGSSGGQPPPEEALRHLPVQVDPAAIQGSLLGTHHGLDLPPGAVTGTAMQSVQIAVGSQSIEGMALSRLSPEQLGQIADRQFQLEEKKLDIEAKNAAREFRSREKRASRQHSLRQDAHELKKLDAARSERYVYLIAGVVALITMVLLYQGKTDQAMVLVGLASSHAVTYFGARAQGEKRGRAQLESKEKEKEKDKDSSED